MMNMTNGEFILAGFLFANFAAMMLIAWKVQVVKADVQKIELATNSMKDQLVAATRSEALLRGNKEGQAERREEETVERRTVARELKEERHTDNISRNHPIPVADNRTATATERTAKASERVADAAERTADKALKK